MDTIEIDNIPTVDISSDDIEIIVDDHSSTVYTLEKESIVEGYKNEYSIVGDGLYASVSATETPQWLAALIDDAVDVATAGLNSNLLEATKSISDAINEINIAKNAYKELINIDATVDGIVAARTTQLNSTLDQVIANIKSLDTVKVTETQALAIAANQISAELDVGGRIASQIDRIDIALADSNAASALSFAALTSAYNSASDQFNATATATEYLQTFAGIDSVGARTGTGLAAYVEDAVGNIGGVTSDVVNGIWYKPDGTVGGSSWEYSSKLYKNGKYYEAGFGLNLGTTGTGTESNPYSSEFWINAEKFKFTNNNKTGSVAPFIIDTSGTQPQITFNGKVTFGNGQTGTIDEAISAVVETVSVGDKNINITDNLIPITSLVADTDNSGYQFIGTPTKSNTSGTDTYAETQIVLDGADEVYSPYVDEMTLAYYYRFGIKGITGTNVFKIVTINSSNVATLNNITVTMNAGQSLISSNWYLIEGIINPTGGDSSASGSIRASDGTKIGIINNFVLPSGTSKLVLGWIANCTISRMKLCKITADTITADYSTVNASISAAQITADIANTLLSDIANDNKLVAVEKTAAKKEWDEIVTEYAKNIAQANTYGVSTSAYTAAYNTLNNYITPLIADLTTTSDITGSTFRNTFKAYYSANIDLLNAITTKVNSNIATVSASTVSANNDILAQKLGYADYSAMVTAATNGQTIINGGYLRTGLIQAGGINANQINTTGLIAENISATNITGKTISGSTLNSSVINSTTINSSSINSASISGGTVSAATLNSSLLSAARIKSGSVFVDSTNTYEGVPVVVSPVVVSSYGASSGTLSQYSSIVTGFGNASSCPRHLRSVNSTFTISIAGTISRKSVNGGSGANSLYLITYNSNGTIYNRTLINVSTYSGVTNVTTSIQITIPIDGYVKFEGESKNSLSAYLEMEPSLITITFSNI